MKRTIYFTLACTVLSFNSMGNHIMLDKANECYHNQNYKQAAVWYQQLIDEGYENAALYYNAGNAYFRDNQLGLAIKNYRLSLREKSNSITYDNLNVARKAVANPIPASNSTMHVVRTWLDTIHINTWTASSILFFFGLVIWIILKSLNRVKQSRWGVLLGILYLISTIGMASTYYYQVISYPMVVIQSKIEFKSLYTSGRAFLYDGTEVLFKREQGSNTLIELPNGEQGWVASNALARCN